ncbi:MAG: dTMP kinase [Balneolaceae bacterium]
MLISFEGIDGCGKSTQISLLKDYLDQHNRANHLFREPGGTEISERIRSLLLHESDEMDPITELLLFSAARSQLISEKVIPLLKQNDIVILDRFYDSTTAYQGYGRKSSSLEHIHLLNSIASHQTKPDLTFYLRISAEEAGKRTQNTEKDRMEKAGLSFFKKVAKGFDDLSESEKRFRTIDATQDKEFIHKKIISAVENFLQ